MRFVVLLHEADPTAWLRATPGEVEEVYARHRAFDAAVERRGTLVVGAALAGADGGEPGSAARTVHAGQDDARRVTDGPYAEAVEQLTGVYVIDVDSMDTAVELAGLLPTGYTVEVRRTMALEDY